MTCLPEQFEPGLCSVLIPAYRAEAYIRGALDSVARQQHGRWELIVVEDGPGEDTQRIVQAFANEVPNHRVVYLRHDENLGPSASRNTGFGQARGEFVAFLDADDLWQPTHLEASLAALARQRADIAFSTVVMFEDGTDHLIGLWGPTKEHLRTVKHDQLRRFPNWLFHRTFIVPSATVMRRRVVETVGGFDSSLRFSEDLEYWLRCVEAGMRFVHVPGCHCLHRKGHSDAATRNMARILDAQARVLEKHSGHADLSPRLRRGQVTYFYTAAGFFNLEDDARAAARLFYRGWRVRPVRLDLLAMAALSYFVMPFTPDLGIVRRIKRARGY
jgi:glycosyltransferase involved in cell wall biosynthesis